MLLTLQCWLCLTCGLSSAVARDGWVADQDSSLDSDPWSGKGWTQVVELQDTQRTKKWSKLGRLSSPEVFGNEEESPSTGDKINRVREKKGGSDVNQISKGMKALPEKDKDMALGGMERGGNTLTTAGVKDILGPGMGGSAVQGIADKRVQKFATEPAPQTAVVGSIVVLPCRVVNKVGQLQWTKDGFGLGTERSLFGFSRYSMIGADDEGDFSLRIQPVLLEDDGHFQCQVSASDGVPGIRTKTVQLTVYVPPEPPVMRPAELDSTAGLLTTIECTSRGGRPPPEILWVDERHPREPLGLGAVTTMELMADSKRAVVTSKLSFTPRRTHDNATISCMTTHQALTSPLSSSVRLRIRYAPEVRVAVAPERLVEGDDAALSCSALANPPQLSYRWYHNRMVVENQTSSTLMLHKISREMHLDSISCEVSNEVGTSKKTQSLHVRFGPVFKSLPQDAAAEMQNEVLLKCDVESNPTASIVWLQEGSEKVISTGPELRVVVGPSTTGSYRCVASVRERDLQFPDLVGRMRVLVKGPPTIVSAGEQLGRPGGTINLECNTVSVPSPIKVTWTYKGRAIDIDDPRYEVKEEQRDGGLKTILVIHDADQTDFGDYNCSVVNEYGVARKLIRLNEEKRIPLLLVMGGGGVVLFLIVVVTFLLLCNKRSPREKVHEKVTLASDTGAPNMYSAASDSRLTESIPNASGTLNRQQETALTGQPVDDSVLGKNSGLRDVTRVTRLRDDNTQDRESMFSQEALQEEESSGFLPLLDVARHDPSRRGSLTEVPSVGGAYLGATSTQPSSLGGAELCTLRRHNNGPDLTQPYHNGSLMRNNTDNCRPLERYSNYPSYAASPPPPPPYPRPSLSTKPAPPPPQRSQVTSPLPSQQATEGAPENGSQCNVGGVDSNYIFSSEAMMKPGTLV